MRGGLRTRLILDSVRVMIVRGLCNWDGSTRPLATHHRAHGNIGQSTSFPDRTTGMSRSNRTRSPSPLKPSSSKIKGWATTSKT